MGDSPAVGPRTDIALSLGILVLCGLGWLATDALPSGLRLDPLGPAYFPRFVLISLAMLATVLLVRSIWGLRRGPATLSASTLETSAAPDGPERLTDEEAEADATPISYPRMLGVLAISIGYVLLMDVLGYFTSSVLYVIALLLLLRVRRPLAIALCAIGLPVVLYTLFGWLLSVPLPGGVLEALRPVG